MESVLQFLPFVAWVLAGATLAITVALGAVLAFHWFRYAMSIGATSAALMAYTVVSFFLLSGMFGSLVLFGSL